MNIGIYNDWYVRTNGRIGPWTITTSQQPTTEQIHNATKVYNYFTALGWSLSAICGMIGNMMHESNLNPALIEQTHRSSLPNAGADLTDVPNNVMLSFYGGSGYGLGLVQWDGYTATAPAGHKLVSFAERYNYIWYDGDCQVFRIQREEETNIQWTTRTYYGITWTWNNYPTNNRTPEESARIWMHCYEVASAGESARQGNARWWYDYFSGGPIPPSPDEWISGDDFSTLATAYDPDITGVQIPYSQWDCIAFVNHVWKDIPVVSANNYSLPSGTNTLWRRNMPGYPTQTYNTTSPDNQNPTPVLWWKGTVAECESEYGEIPAGALLFHQISEAGPPAIPSQYAGDGIGNFAHVGIYVGNNEVMQSGGQDSGSVPGGGVHRSTYNPNAWNYVAFVCYVDSTGTGPTPPPPPPTYLPNWLLLWYANKKKEVIKNVRKTI